MLVRNSDLMLKNGTLASPATAFASRVLPVPGGPTNRTPEGTRAPSLVNLSGLFSNSCRVAAKLVQSVNSMIELMFPVRFVRLVQYMSPDHSLDI